MGKLIDPNRTRKAREARQERAKIILEAAHAAFTRYPYSEVSLDTLGQQAGVKQGQATLAYRSREALFMTVVLAQMRKWYDALEADLNASDDPLSPEEAADIIADKL